MSDRRFSSGESDARKGQLAAAVAEQLEALDDLGPEAPIEETKLHLRKLGEATLALARTVDGDLPLLSDSNGQFDLLGSVLDLPTRLGAAGETALAVRVAEALKFCAPDDMKGQIALVHAQAGDRKRALELVLTNLETAGEPFISEFRAGDVYRELGEADAAEAYYRRSLAVANSASGRSEASLRIASLLIDTGREAEAVAFLAQQRAQPSARELGTAAPLPRVGRNDPCPCGSGKKYKKCHGA
jgi:tetratricopeptide (TPR) repeat protein